MRKNIGFIGLFLLIGSVSQANWERVAPQDLVRYQNAVIKDSHFQYNNCVMKVVETKDGIERRHEYRLSPDRARIYVQNSVGNADFAEINQGTKFPQPALNFETEIDTNYHYDTRTVTETSRKLLVFSDENFKAIEKIRVHDSSYVYSYDENVSNGDLKNPDFENALNYISDVSSILICQ